MAFSAISNIDDMYITIDSTTQSGTGMSVVTVKIARYSASAAYKLVHDLSLNISTIELSLARLKPRFAESVVLFIQITGCPSGYELLSTLSCISCPVNFFCDNGKATACASGYFAPEGSNASWMCERVTYVAIVMVFPLPLDNLTRVQNKFQIAIASTVGVKPDHVVITSIYQVRRLLADSAQINAAIAADNDVAAASISTKLIPSELNSNFVAFGLPQGSLESVSIEGVTTKSKIQTEVIIGVSIGAFVFALILLIAAHYFSRLLIKYASHKKFLAAIGRASMTEAIAQEVLPYALRKFYIAEKILGIGGFGCVVQARSKAKGADSRVAIKLIVPAKGTFTDQERRQLRRECLVLELFAKKSCEHAVAGIGAGYVGTDVCWLTMELLQGDNVGTIIKGEGPINEAESVKVARNILAALKVMHSDGIIHRDIKPSNIMRCQTVTGESIRDIGSHTYKLIDYGTALGIDESVAKSAMMTMTGTRDFGMGTLCYMSPEMIKEPGSASYPTDLWSLGVTMFEMVSGSLPFKPDTDSDLLWIMVIAGDMDEKVVNVLDVLDNERRAGFDNNLAKVISKALERRVCNRYASTDEMHDGVYSCLIFKGEAFYSVFISYRVASELPLACLLFDELNHTVTPGGHRVTIFWDAHRLVKGEDWEEGFATGLLNSLCFFPILSYGSTAPLAAFSEKTIENRLAEGWEAKPMGRHRLQGTESDIEDNVLKEFLIAGILLDRLQNRTEEELGMLQLAYPVLVGRQQPQGHPDYPRMGNFFDVQCGGGQYSNKPSLPTNLAVSRFLLEKAGFPDKTCQIVQERSIASALQRLTNLQGCQLWNHSTDLEGMDLSREQLGLVGKGYAGPPVNIGGVMLSEEQRINCLKGFDHQQLRMLKAEVCILC